MTDITYEQLVIHVAVYMQESAAWPAVFAAGSAYELARSSISVIAKALSEPTEEMIKDGYDALMAWDARTGDDLGVSDVFLAMLRASPLYKAEK